MASHHDTIMANTLLNLCVFAKVLPYHFKPSEHTSPLDMNINYYSFII